MILQYIFQGAALAVVHTGAFAGMAAAMGSDNSVSVGITSFIIGIPSLLTGAYIADTYSPARNDEAIRQKHATMGGLIAYAAGSAFGFALKLS